MVVEAFHYIYLSSTARQLASHIPAADSIRDITALVPPKNAMVLGNAERLKVRQNRTRPRTRT
jgi:hypothetical protein